eukprot:2115869-Rhodomonas_salina.2
MVLADDNKTLLCAGTITPSQICYLVGTSRPRACLNGTDHPRFSCAVSGSEVGVAYVVLGTGGGVGFVLIGTLVGTEVRVGHAVFGTVGGTEVGMGHYQAAT